MKKIVYLGLVNGEKVCECETYLECLKIIGCCNEYGWYLPDWKDCGICAVETEVE